MRPSPNEALAEATALTDRQPVYWAGSGVSAVVHGRLEYGDLDGFVPTQQVLISTVQIMLDNGWTLDERYDRVWYRWLRYGFKGWHTNSIRLHSKKDVPVNLVYKIVDGHPTTSLAQVLESFDFGLLAVGYDAETRTFRDMRSYLFPKLDPDGPLPMMPNKRDNWVQGFISQYNGLRQAARYAKYHGYAYDMSLVKPDLITGYRQAAKYHATREEENHQWLSQIYFRIADLIEADDLEELITSYKEIDFNDSLDQIMAVLE